MLSLVVAASLLSISPAPTAASATHVDGSPITSGERFDDPPFDVSSIRGSAPTPVCELDLNALKGEVRRVSWPPDNAYIHVRTVEDRAVPHDYIVSLEDREVSPAFGEPAWGSAYWRENPTWQRPACRRCGWRSPRATGGRVRRPSAAGSRTAARRRRT